MDTITLLDVAVKAVNGVKEVPIRCENRRRINPNTLHCKDDDELDRIFDFLTRDHNIYVHIRRGM